MANILLVDDDDNFRSMLRITLQRLGHQISEASNGLVALKLFQLHLYDVVILDLIMPEKEGIETIRDLRKQRPDVKIIAMSGGGRLKAMDILSVAKAVGADQVLAKPFSNDNLLDALNAVTAH